MPIGLDSLVPQMRSLTQRKCISLVPGKCSRSHQNGRRVALPRRPRYDNSYRR